MIRCLMQGSYLTYGRMYTLVDRSGSQFKVVNDLGNYEWYPMSYFQW